jgi:hypothetical protein
MKISNTRVNQSISAYDQARIDAAKQKSDSRVVSRAIADKAREESIKATAEYKKGLLDTEKSQMDLEKTRLDAEKARMDLEKANIDLIKANTYKAHVDFEHMKLEKEKKQIEYNQTIAAAELLRLNNEKDTLDKERLILSREVAYLDAEKSRFDLEIAHVNYLLANAIKTHTISDKAQLDASMLVQRSKIMKTLQILTIKSCKRVDELYFKKSVISITNIYQKTYSNNKYATGFGDFIRGCYFLLDFCELFHFQANIVINHPLDEFLENHSITHNYGITEIVSMFEYNNWNKHILNQDNIIINTIRKNETMSQFVNYLCASPIEDNNINIYNILFPYFDVSAEHRKIMCNILKPSQEIKDYVVSTLKQFDLTEHNYISIHIRSGDNYLNCVDKQFNLAYLNHITNNITLLLNKYPDKYFLLIADNNFIKLYLASKQLHRLYIICNEIGHLGENTQLERNKVKNTMLDFYLFAYSSMIYAFSSYDHGSGFSFWCAKTYGIPYSCKIIKH